jgi:K+ potassium transporter
MRSLSTCRPPAPHWYPCAGSSLPVWNVELRLSKIATLPPREGVVRSSLPALSLAALGVVFGDSTSPLYTLKTVLGLTGSNPDPTTTLGALSLVIWTLIVVTTIKYVSFAIRVDNDGEGGILALMSLLGVKRQHRPVIVAAGLFGAALIYGDGAITPAISVLSALEGLDIVTSTFHPFILPVAVVIPIALFAIQPLGTTRIGSASVLPLQHPGAWRRWRRCAEPIALCPPQQLRELGDVRRDRCRRHCALLQTSSNMEPRLSFLSLALVNVRYHASPAMRSMPPMIPMSPGAVLSAPNGMFTSSTLSMCIRTSRASARFG